MLFNDTACFSMRVPKETIQTWLTHGGRIYSGRTGAAASYFFAVSREDEWTSILCRRSVVVIHVGWILHCVAHSFRVPVVGYILDDGFDAGPPFSRMEIQDHTLIPVVSPHYPQRVSGPFVPSTKPQTPLCRVPPNVLRKRKRQRDGLAYPSALHSESGDSLPRRPHKRRMLSLGLSSSSAESLCDITITEAHDSAVTKNHDAGSTHVITPDICVANTSPDNDAQSVTRHFTSPFKAVSKYNSQGSSFHCSLQNHAPEYALVANGASSVACLKDSPPVPAIDLTRLQFASRNRLHFPLLHLEPVAGTGKVCGREDGENSTRLTTSDHTPNQIAQDVSRATQQPGNSVVPAACNNDNNENTETASSVTRRGTRVGPSPRRLGEAIDSRHDTVTYHMDQILRTRKHATGRNDIQCTTLWESNAMWKGMRFWHENLTWNAGI
ncbi:uncharacterized protein EDB93DRAFT_1329426 [Suillus bovinus]|uniref:uncharacterized protein n=1 Tax=Suillus bovinus TaxID=48563 RepID=UPI001B86EB77|nr:uncharacterized protein EDB93DRAFT_1329426 [Suillus bovinus]KAG2143829.1 hypothetical protein EDB93DRAFT_1329426 [Suillus bovinus]